MGINNINDEGFVKQCVKNNKNIRIERISGSKSIDLFVDLKILNLN